MRKFLLLLSSAIIFFGSCKKSDTTTTSTDTYLPLKSGTFWTYLATNTGVTTTTSNFTLTVTSKDTVVNARTYKVISNSAGSNNYWAQVGSDYYRYGSFPGASFIGNIEELYLKENLTTNGTWNSVIPINYNGFPVNVTATYKIVSTGMSKSVGANSFTDVTQVRVDFSAAAPPILPATNLGGGDFFYAKNIGMINLNVAMLANTNLNIAGSTVKWDIQSYKIN